MRARLPTADEVRSTLPAWQAALGCAEEQEIRLAAQTTCYLCGQFLGPGRRYLEDPDDMGTYCHLSCFHRAHSGEDWYRKATMDRMAVAGRPTVL